jgi:type I restriction-modification system DNA methylase subunit
MDSHKAWRKKPVENHEQWIKTVLLEGAQWAPEYVAFKDDVAATFEVSFPEHAVAMKPWAVLFDAPAKTEVNPIMLVTTVPMGQDLRAVPEDGWSASPIDRMARLLRRLKVQVGLVTNGRWWALVWADSATTSASAVFDSLVWNEEQLMRDAFLSLIGIKLQVGVAKEDRLPQLFQQSLLQQEEITDALGKQVRQAVELLVQSFSESRIAALANKRPDPLPASETEPYEAAVTVMMRIVFMLFAEERGLLPVTQELYGRSYGISGLLDELEEEERRDATSLDRTTAVWHRVLSTSVALYSGATFEDMRMPAYGGSLFDPSRFSWLYANHHDSGLNLVVHDRVMLHVLRSIQIVRHNNQARRISFREIDVEQIGYVYEGLLGYASRRVTDDAVLGFQGAEGDEPEIALPKVLELRDAHKNNEKFVDALLKLIEVEQPAAKPQTKNRMISALKGNDDEALAKQQLGAVTAYDADLIKKILPLVGLLRRDLRGLPYVVPRNGIVVTETSSRKNAGAHYTPRSLAEEVVLHALEPLVYSPGPLQEEDPSKWVLRSSVEILNLKVADIAVGSGAFLVAAARYLAARLVEAWKIEGAVKGGEREFDPDRPSDPTMTKALREVVARCLYGADINEMAVEMCKLSLWLISLDPARPFSFLDDKIMLGNSLLGLTSMDQLRLRHIFPESKPATKREGLFDDIYSPIETAINLRKEIASSPVDDSDVHRSAAHKSNLLRQANEATDHLREIADAIVAAGLPLGGKPGKKLDEAYGKLEYAINESQRGNRTVLERILEDGLTPEVKTDYERWKPLHWILEAPQVMEAGGFDAIIGNPPFLVYKKISGAVGTSLREWFANVITKHSGKADLVTYFVQRAASLCNERSTLGLIGANALVEGDSLRLGPETLADLGWSFYRVDKNRRWPVRSVGTNISIIWAAKNVKPLGSVLNGELVESISALLTSDEHQLSRPETLIHKPHIYIGAFFLGDGFLMNEEEAAQILEVSPQEADVVRRFLNAQDLNSAANRVGKRWIIDMGQLDSEAAKSFEQSWERLEKLVKPERQKLDKKKYSRRVEKWWQYASSSSELRQISRTIDGLIVIPIVSKLMVPAKVEADQVFGSSLAVSPIDSYGFFALLSSWMHRSWAQWWGSSMRGIGFRYTISDCYDTFPFPRATKEIDVLGTKLDKLQRKLAIQRDIGLTKLYTLVNTPSCNDDDIVELREIHEQIDRAVVKAYGFQIELGEFEISEFKGQPQWGPPASQRIEILQLLLAENQRQQVEGVIEWPAK